MAIDYFETRKAERKPVHIEAFYELKGIKAACEILDISSTGLKIRVKGLLYKNDKVNIIMDDIAFSSVVISVDGNIIGTRFMGLTDSQMSYLLNRKP